LKGKVRFQPPSRFIAAISQPFQAHESSARKCLREPPGKPRFSAAKWANDVVERSHATHFKSLPAPGPRKIAGDDEFGWGLQQARKAIGDKQLTEGEVGSQFADLLYRAANLMHAAFARRLVSSQGGLQSSGVAFQDSHDMGDAEAEPTQGNDLGGAGHFVGTIDSSSGFGPDRRQKAALFVQP
jgi:hypothetical protein